LLLLHAGTSVGQQVFVGLRLYFVRLLISLLLHEIAMYVNHSALLLWSIVHPCDGCFLSVRLSVHLSPRPSVPHRS